MIGQRAIKKAVIGHQKADWRGLYLDWTREQYPDRVSVDRKFITKIKSKNN